MPLANGAGGKSGYMYRVRKNLFRFKFNPLRQARQGLGSSSGVPAAGGAAPSMLGGGGGGPESALPMRAKEALARIPGQQVEAWT